MRVPGEQSPITFRDRKQTKRIILHESHTGPEVKSATAYLRANGRANGLLEIGYHFVIERDGTLNSTRPHAAIGSHAPGANHDSIGICLAADRGWTWQDHPAQLASLRTIRLALIGIYGPLPLLGHDEVVKRAKRTHKCPSFDMDWVRSHIGATTPHDH